MASRKAKPAAVRCLAALAVLLLLAPPAAADLALKFKPNGPIKRIMKTSIPETNPAPAPAGGPRAAAARAAATNPLPVNCPDSSDQIGTTCPEFPKLKRRIPKDGGPVGKDPEPLIRTFTKAELVAAGLPADKADSKFPLVPAQAKPVKGRRKLLQTRVTPPSYPLNQYTWCSVRNNNIGVAPIHLQLNRYNKVIMIDRKWNSDQTPNPTGIEALEYDVVSNTGRTLHLASNTWCSAGVAQYGGRIISLGGGGDGVAGGDAIRTFDSCSGNTCDFVETAGQRLLARRWYPSGTLLPDGRLLITSGTDYDAGTGDHGDTFEIWPRNAAAGEGDLANMQMPVNWNNAANTAYGRFLYPHVHLLPDGSHFLLVANLWHVARLQARNSALLKGPRPLDPRWQDGGTPVTYPGEGTSVLMPLEAPFTRAVVVTFGGTWSWFDPNGWVDPDCAIIVASDANPVADRTRLSDPNKRVMPYCIYMLDGNIVCLGGSSTGSAGYYAANSPQNTVSLLNTGTMTFTSGPTATVDRLYHSVATLTHTGAILIGGSNPAGGYFFQYDPANSVWPAEYRLEYYYPWYFSKWRPIILSVSTTSATQGSTFTARVQVTGLNQVQQGALIMPGFSTHNQQYSQRYVRIATNCPLPTGWDCPAGGGGCTASTICTFTVPSSRNVVPVGDYMFIVLDNGVPAQEAKWIGIGP